jgi:hypothetical protein
VGAAVGASVGAGVGAGFAGADGGSSFLIPLKPAQVPQVLGQFLETVVIQHREATF